MPQTPPTPELDAPREEKAHPSILPQQEPATVLSFTLGM